jgi:hypothetical protein
MEQKNLFIVLGIAGVCLVLCAGLGGFMVYRVVKPEIDRENSQQDLEEIATAMQDHDNMAGRPPANLAELQGHLNDSAIVERIRMGEIQVVWRAASAIDQPGGASSVIYAWETNPNSNGKRMVVFMDGMARELDDAEFHSTPKAATSKVGR